MQMCIRDRAKADAVKALVDGEVSPACPASILQFLSLIHILTDSDSAGFTIRSFLNGIVPKELLINVYIPDIFGKEKRKSELGQLEEGGLEDGVGALAHADLDGQVDGYQIRIYGFMPRIGIGSPFTDVELAYITSVIQWGNTFPTQVQAPEDSALCCPPEPRSAEKQAE